jgi:glycosyltransferase involved in cell wall biosynthesis
LFMQEYAGGGVEGLILQLADAFVTRGHEVDVLIARLGDLQPQQLPAGVRLVKLQRSSRWVSFARMLASDPGGAGALLPVMRRRKPPWIFRYVPDLARYLRSVKPRVVLSAYTPTNIAAAWAHRQSGDGIRLVVSEHSVLSEIIRRARRRHWQHYPGLVLRSYARADAVVAVSKAVAADLAETTGIPRERITTIYNPIVTRDLQRKASLPVDHPWFSSNQPPVLLAAGRLSREKDFPTLIKAFAGVRSVRRCRLVILGEGKERSKLQRLIDEQQLTADVDMPGFTHMLFAYMARASLFVLCSTSEGFGNVLVEAMACGCPVLSTDCPGGPREILDHGKFGRLVPVGDVSALTEAILEELSKKPDLERLKQRADYFSAERSIQAYLQVLFPGNQQT